MSAKKTVRQRFEGKQVIMRDSVKANIVEIDDSVEGEERLNCLAGNKNHWVPVSSITTRGGVFFQISEEEERAAQEYLEQSAADAGAPEKPARKEQKPEHKPAPEKAEKEAAQEHNPVADVASVVKSTPTPEKKVVKQPAHKEQAKHQEPEVVYLTCQFCSHQYTQGAGYAKPEQNADVCPHCVDLATQRLSVVPADITPRVVTEYLARFYGMVSGDLQIVISGTSVDSAIRAAAEVQGEEVAGAGQEAHVAAAEYFEEAPVFETGAQEFRYALSKVAKTIRDIIAAVAGYAEILEEKDDEIVLTFEEFDFALTALCGGFIILNKEEGPVREEEFVALDELFAHFCTEPEVAAGAEEDADSDEDADEDAESVDDDDDDAESMDEVEEEPEEPEHLEVGTFYRLQNCKNEANNKKLVKIIEYTLPDDADGAVVYRVIDKDGKTYKVTEGKLKPSAKSF